jgi:hypothetical protein
MSTTTARDLQSRYLRLAHELEDIRDVDEDMQEEEALPARGHLIL